MSQDGRAESTKEIPDLAATPFSVDCNEAVTARFDVFYVESEEAEEHSQLRAAVNIRRECLALAVTSASAANFSSAPPRSSTAT